MENTNWQPKWWAEDKHGSTWNRVKEALKRDWEQTKSDVGAGGRDLDQDVNDTVKQAAGKDAIPPRNQPNASSGTQKRGHAWTDVEGPMRYGYGARQQYGSQHADWNDKLENTLKTEWEDAKGSTRREWNDVKQHVRSGYDRSRS
ncbi:MAG: hypothetical protein H7Z43_06750 [Clostridia bacterium]|nr:hypothetical protein [Deltaproteobacteria bacterium]